MTHDSLELTTEIDDWMHKLGRKHMPAQSPGAQYRLTVLAPDVLDLVWCVGGWLFDRAMLGWDITVFVVGDPDARPLRILGLKTASLEVALKAWSQTGPPDAVSVAAELYQRNPRIRRHVKKGIDQESTEVTLWGRNWPTESIGQRSAVEHQLSSAARAFKAQALASTPTAGASDLVAPTETFCGGPAFHMLTKTIVPVIPPRPRGQ